MPSCYVQILGASSNELVPGFYVFFEKQRYLFNVGEGCQKVCFETGVKLSKLAQIFLTRLNWEQTGGLPGIYDENSFKLH